MYTSYENEQGLIIQKTRVIVLSTPGEKRTLSARNTLRGSIANLHDRVRTAFL